MAGLRSIAGGEIPEYTNLMSQARDEAVERMSRTAEQMGANAIVGARFTTSGIMNGASGDTGVWDGGGGGVGACLFRTGGAPNYPLVRRP